MPSAEQQTDPLGDDGCFAWVDGLRCGYTRDTHDGEHHAFLSRAEFEARGAKGFEQHRRNPTAPQSAASMLADMRKAREEAETLEAPRALSRSAEQAALRQTRAYNARDALVRVDRDAVLNPAAISAMLEDTMTHRDGAAVTTTVRTSIFLASRAAPIVVELPLDEVLRRITTARYENERSEGAPSDAEIAKSLIGEGG